VKKLILRVFGMAGVLLFGSFLYFTYSLPQAVEDFASDFLREKLEEKTEAKIDSLQLNRPGGVLGRAAGRMLEDQRTAIERIRAELKAGMHEKIAQVIAEMSDLSCECRRKIAARIRSGYEFQLTGLEQAGKKLQEFMQVRYMEVSTELKRDIRIFLSVNLGVFVFLLLVSWLRPAAISHLFLPGTLLFVSTAICSWFYVFEQNWLLTIIYGDYTGLGFLVYVGIVFLFLCDIAFNRGRVTREVINAILNAIGSAAQLAPC